MTKEELSTTAQTKEALTQPHTYDTGEFSRARFGVARFGAKSTQNPKEALASTTQTKEALTQ